MTITQHRPVTMKPIAAARAAHGVSVAALVLVIALLLAAWSCESAHAEPGWALTATSYPTNLSPAAPSGSRVSGTIVLEMLNIGSSAAGCNVVVHTRETNERIKQPQCPVGVGSPEENQITVTDRLPSGLRAVEAGELKAIGQAGAGTEPLIRHALWTCTGNGPGSGAKVEGATEVTCTNKVTKTSAGESALEVIPGGGGAPTFAVEELTFPTPIIGISVDVQPGAQPHETNTATIAGGGAPASAEANEPVVVSDEKPPYELTKWTGWFSNADGTIDEQAGSHPYEANFDLALATALSTSPRSNGAEVAGGELRTAEVELPEGFVGDPTAVPQCTRELFVAEQCPVDTTIGTTTAYFANFPGLGLPVFNLVPPAGVPAEFGFSLQGLNTFLDASVRTGSDYGVTEHVSAVAHKEIVQAVTTLWGQPGDPSHNRWRSGAIGGCPIAELEEGTGRCSMGRFTGVRPFLTLPTSCGSRLPFVLRTTAWTGAVSERTFYMHDQDEHPLTLSGCGNLAFDPSLTISPEASLGDSPTGLNVNVVPSLAGLQAFHALSGSAIRDARVALPAGFVVNPGRAAGLQECGEAAAALTSAAEVAAGLEDTAAPSCPAASKVGVASARSPLIEGAAEKELHGNVYLLSSDPPHLRLLVALSADGVNVKLVLKAELDPVTGQITTTLENAPQLPVSDFSLVFDGGERAAVDTPARCATYEAGSRFTPWSAPFASDFSGGAALAITAGAGGGACPAGAQLPFAPALVAGTTGTQATGFTGFTTSLSRGDGQQRIAGLRFKAPAGISALISKVPLCPDARAAAGTCEAASLIGHASVLSGPGPNPLVIPQPGEPAPQVFLTGPYEGAPFGLSIVTRLLAGPFDLGTIVTRARIEVDPHTAQVTVATDPLPQIIDGVPTDIRAINATVDRPGFMFNPTHCKPASFSGEAQGAAPPYATEAAVSAPVGNSFDSTGCRGLAFNPGFSVSTAGKTSRANGASLKVKIAFAHAGPQAAGQSPEANIARVHVELPKALPSRLTTLRKACTERQFAANPAGCPAASIVGHARASTPILPVALEGPAYFVSHGGAAFPELIMVLQGEGVTIQLNGETHISKSGITSSTFSQVPDAPVESFTLTLPQGPDSALAANGDLCRQKLTMPTALVAQNGATHEQSTRIAVEGCSGGLRVISHRVAGRTLQLAVYAPAAGRLTAAGSGLSGAAKSAGGSETLKLRLRATRSGRFTAHVKVSFQPAAPKARARAKRQTTTLRVRFAK